MLHDQDLVSVQEVRTKVERAWSAWQTYRGFTQAQIDAVVEAVAAAGRANARALAELAVEETGYGNVEDKTAKNMLNADILPGAIRGMRTVGVLKEDGEKQVVEIGVPVGVVAAICPTTNPTSTVIFKTIISLKAGNAVVLSPHPRARRCTCATAAILMRAAVEAGAPEGIVQCLDQSTLEGTKALMTHPKTGVVLATGGSGMVRSAYSSGKPAYGVGPGNVPVLIDTTAPLAEAVEKVVSGKSFDYGTVCSSEQTVVAERSLREATLAELKRCRAHVCSAAEKAALERTLFSGGTTVRAECVGQNPQKIAQLAGFSVPDGTSIIVAEIDGVGRQHPLSAEKLSPVLALLFVDGGYDAAVSACEQILQFGGLGHTAVIHATDEARIRQFGARMPAFRVLVNTPAPQGSVGITTNVQPSMTLGCGAMAGNITSDNVGPQHLINIKRIAWNVKKSDSPVPAPATGSPVAVDRGTLMAAVEKYLSARGVALTGADPAAAKPAAAVPAHAVVESVVDRFIARREAAPARPAAAAPACGCSLPPGPVVEVPVSKPEPPQPASIPAPKVEIVDFVCEADVRQAIALKRKIFIGPKTIVTPSAREVAGPDEVLVMAER